MARSISTRWLRFTAICFAIAMLLSILLSFSGYSVALLPDDKTMTFTWYAIGAFAVVMLVAFAASKDISARTKGTILPVVVWLFVFVLNGLLRGKYWIFLTSFSLILPVVSGYFAFHKFGDKASGQSAGAGNENSGNE